MRYVIFLVIPACVYLAVIPLREAWGHYYYAINSDPSYLYLFNGLNIAMGQPSAHVDNPGTTTQLFSAMVIRVTALIKGVEDMQKDIILHPEEYIIIINRTLFLLCLAVLFLFGVFAWRFTGRLWFSLFLQTVPFYSWQMMRIFLKVSPEMMLFIACLLWVLTLLRLAAKDDFRENHLPYTIWFALLTGFSLASKLTMIPFVLIPLMLMPLRIFINYLLLSFISFHLFIFPAWTHYDYMIGWIGRLFRHTSLYGGGEPTIVDVPQALFSLARLAVLEHPLCIATVAAVVTLTFVFRNKFFSEALRHTPDVRMLIALVLVVTVQLLMIAKHFNPHYLIPSLMLFTAIIFFTVRLYSPMVSLAAEKMKWLKNTAVQHGVFILILVAILTRHSARYFSGGSIGEWFREAFLSSAAWFVPAIAIFFVISLLLRRQQKARKGFLSISIWIAAIIYAWRHADLEGFRDRLYAEARESQAVMDVISRRYSDYTIIYGERSSSVFYALRYGASENFAQPHHFLRMKELCAAEVYFWDHMEKLTNWTTEVSLKAILARNENVLLECDKRFTFPEKLRELELGENVVLERVYSGSAAELYWLRPKMPSI